MSNASAVEPTRRSFADHPLAQLTLVRFREFWREPEAVFWVFVFPILLAAGLGLAFRNRPPEVLHVAVPQSAAGAQELAQALRSDSALDVQLLPDRAAEHALRTGQVALLASRTPDSAVIFSYDETRPEARDARLIADGAIQRAAGRRDLVPVRVQQVKERGSRYIDFVVPGLLGMNLMGSGIWGIGFGIVDARKKKLLKRLIATPMSRSQYLASFILSRLGLLVVEVITLVGFALLIFDVPLRGSALQLGAICLLAALAFGALGLLVASRARTMEAASGLMNLVMLPMWIFSGVFFSASNFPAAAQPFIQALPLTATIDAIRGTMLQGASLASIGSELAIMSGWLAVSFLLALKLFRWR
ncbi:MAG TPA: ABC transporter permease [Gemmatimonadaceae bacterium]|nr:ABC transporter permease [Gemmatimonadaceae bacterium]